MTILAYVKRLFSLDTLDTRFSNPSKSHSSNVTNEPLLSDPSQSPSNHVSHEFQSQKSETIQYNDGSSMSRWKSSEFKFYAVVFLVAIPLMFKSVYDVSNRKHTSFTLMRRARKSTKEVRLTA